MTDRLQGTGIAITENPDDGVLIVVARATHLGRHPLAVVLPWAFSAYLNQRLFRYDALAEHADQQEMRRVFSERFSDLFVLGLMTGLLYFIPFINLVAPVFSALAFTYLCLDELSRMRSAEDARPPVTKPG